MTERWSIPTSGLTSRRAAGGPANLRGVSFQSAYAAMQLVDLVRPETKLIAVRTEGAQDVDLFFADGSEEYVQLKNEAGARYTIAALAEIFQGFALNLLEAGRPATLSFRLIARSNSVDAAAGRLVKRQPSDADVRELAEAIAKPATSPLAALAVADREALVRQLVEQSTLELGAGDERGERLSFESHALADLATCGVASAELPKAFATLLRKCQTRRTFERKDVDELLKHHRADAAVKVFESRVERLTDALIAKRADRDRIMEFYAGAAPIGWDLIAASADVERDQQKALVKSLAEPADRMRFLCISGEPGAGKSTLLYRIAADLHRDHGALVIRVLDNEEPDVWYRMPEFYAHVGRPFYMIVDDVFRHRDVVRAMKAIDTEVPVTIIATSRANEVKTSTVRGAEIVPLHPPSPQEKKRVLRRLGKSLASLTGAQAARLESANQFLVLMMELTAGKELREIVRDSIDRLREQDAPAAAAYEYVCFAYRHSVSVPETLLEQLDAEGRFHQLPDRTSLRGLVFYDDRPLLRRLRTGHAVIAEVAFEIFSAMRSPAAVLKELARTVEATAHQLTSRQFFAFLLAAMARHDRELLRASRAAIASAIERCQSLATIRELTVWRRFHEELGEQDEAEARVRTTFTREPVEANDCNVLISVMRQAGRERDALPPIERWIAANETIHRALPGYLMLVERYGTPAEHTRAIRTTRAWLKKHDNDNVVRTRYVHLVASLGTRRQVIVAMERTRRWLKLHSSRTDVRMAYAAAMERRCPGEVNRVIRELEEWLDEHVEDSAVRPLYLSLVDRYGTVPEVRAAIAKIETWLDRHQDDDTVRAVYLATLRRRFPHRIRPALGTTKTWLDKHPRDSGIRAFYLSAADDYGERRDILVALAQTRRWLAKYPHDPNMRVIYLSVLIKHAAPKHVERAVAETVDWLKTNPATKTADRLLRFVLEQSFVSAETATEVYETVSAARPNDLALQLEYASWLRRAGRIAEADAIIRRLPLELPKGFDRYRFGRLFLEAGRNADAAVLLREFIGGDPKHQMAHDTLGRALGELAKEAAQAGDTTRAAELLAEAEAEVRLALKLARGKGAPVARFHNRLGWLHVQQERWKEAEREFTDAIRHDAEFFGSYHGLGIARRALGDEPGARTMFEAALARIDPAERAESHAAIARLLDPESVAAS